MKWELTYIRKELEKNKLFLPEELNSKKPNQICVSQKPKYEDSNKIWKTTFGIPHEKILSGNNKE